MQGGGEVGLSFAGEVDEGGGEVEAVSLGRFEGWGREAARDVCRWC